MQAKDSTHAGFRELADCGFTSLQQGREYRIGATAQLGLNHCDVPHSAGRMVEALPVTPESFYGLPTLNCHVLNVGDPAKVIINQHTKCDCEKNSSFEWS